MFQTLAEKITKAFSLLKGRTDITQKDLDITLSHIRKALIEADVAVNVVGFLLENIRQKALGKKVLESLRPDQQIINIVHKTLVEVLSNSSDEEDKANKQEVPSSLFVSNSGPSIYFLVGLQGSGKTTTAAKLAFLLKKENKKILLSSVDIYRPAAQEQLRVLAKMSEVDYFERGNEKELPIDTMQKAKIEATKKGYDVLILDTAGRLHIDKELMKELQLLEKEGKPHEILLVVDSLIGQDAVKMALKFKKTIGITGIILTRVDGDGRGGAAVSMRAATKVPIIFMGTGEKIDQIESFYPSRVANRILGMGDIVSLVERVQESSTIKEAEETAQRIKKGSFNMNDLMRQLDQMKKIGGLEGLLKFLPGAGKIKNSMQSMGLNDSIIVKQKAIIHSMTKRERETPSILNGSRKRRVARGSGVEISEINRLLKLYRQMTDLSKKANKNGRKGGMESMIQNLRSMGGNSFPIDELLGLDNMGLDNSSNKLTSQSSPLSLPEVKKPNSNSDLESLFKSISNTNSQEENKNE